jgi:tRNA-dihydrouridine synthase 4
MVRYSKLAFRLLCRQYDCDLCFTPMIIAVPFNRSQSARDSDFTTTPEDRPLMVQFAARDPTELALAAQRCEGYVDGVDINCGW